MQGVTLDFEAWLTFAAVIAGIIWALERYVWRRRRAPGKRANWFVEFAHSFFPVLLVVLLLRSFVVEPFRIPSPSMVPTLLPGDFILVSKFSYGLKLPIFHTQVLELGDPQRGDVAVFRWPVNPGKNFIKRIIGVPGDHIVIADDQLFINGELVDTERLGIYHGDGVPESQRPILYSEQLGRDWHKMLQIAGSDRSEVLRFTVPEGMYFVMGDNRDHSLDSRYWGFVPEENFVGQAFLIWFSVDFDPFDLRWSRIGNIID